MHVPRRKFSAANEESAFLRPSESWIVGQAVLLVIVASWICGGVTPTALNWILVIVLLGLPILALRHRETRVWNWRPFVPLLLWAMYLGIALLNPSHQATPQGWIPRSDWIRWLPTTVDKAHTLEDAQLWLPALLEAALFVALLHSPRAARLFWSAIAINGFVLATVGALFRFAGSEQVLGFIDPPEPTYFFATFFYKNHWAAYGALAAVASFTLALQFFQDASAGDFSARGRFLLFGSMGALIAVTLPLPGSRAGVLFAVVIVGTFLTMLLVNWRRTTIESKTGRRVAIIGMTVMAVGITAFGVDAYLPRGEEDIARTTRELKHGIDGNRPDLRLLVSRDTWRMAKQRPFFGWGPGCFEIVFPIFQGRYLRGPDGRATARFEFAHNDWLQTLAEDGAIGTILLVASLGWMTRRSWRRANRIGRVAIAGCGLIALHAMIDFPLHNPAVLLLWVTMLASVGALTPGRTPRRPDGDKAIN